MRLLSAYNVVLPSLYNAGGAVDLRTLMDGVRRALSDNTSLSLASSELRIDLLRLVAATGLPAKQLLKMVCEDLHRNNHTILLEIIPQSLSSLRFLADLYK